MPRPKATEAQKTESRSKIRHAAAELYREQGPDNLTARAIAIRAGVSVGTLYSHFSDLSELARSLWQGPVDKFDQHLRTLVEVQTDPVKRIELLLLAYLEFARTNPELYQGTFLYVRPANREAPEKQDFATNKMGNKPAF
ncbi:MAG: TetR/AcrR family transcriptional regulator [Gammaproteobacteria bacterium]